MVYGNIRDFVTEEVLNNHDVISNRHDYNTGTFCLFRNNKLLSGLFMESKDYKQVCSSAEHFCFDECNLFFKELQNGASIYNYPDNIQSMTYVVKNAVNQGRLKTFFDFIIIEGATGNIEWEKGKIYYKYMHEAMFYYLIRFKTLCKRRKILNPIPNTFYFTPRKIFFDRIFLSYIFTPGVGAATCLNFSLVAREFLKLPGLENKYFLFRFKEISQKKLM